MMSLRRNNKVEKWFILITTSLNLNLNKPAIVKLRTATHLYPVRFSFTHCEKLLEKTTLKKWQFAVEHFDKFGIEIKLNNILFLDIS